MQSRPDNWAAVFAVPHVTEYRFLIGGSEYRESDIQGTPIIEKPLMQEPCIGRCCTGSLTIAVRPHANETIPKAACVQAFCRLKSRNGNTVKYWVSRRSTSGSLVTLTCRDGMMLAGRTYLDKTQYTVWPVAMADVFNEIVSLMGVTVDSRTVIKTGGDYKVAYPNEDVLMSEILSMIAAAHGGIVHDVVVQQREVVEHLDGRSCGQRLLHVVGEDAAGERQQHGAEAFAAPGERIADRGV